MSKITIHRPEGIEEREMTPAEQAEFDKVPAQGQAFDDAGQAQKALKASATYKIYHKDLGADSTDNGVVAPLVLEAGDIIKIQAATANKIEGMISYMEIE